MIAALQAALAHGGTRLRQVSIPLQPVSLEALFDTLPAEEAVYWADAGEVCVALGATRRFTARGPDRFIALRDQTASLPPRSRVFAGMAFSPANGEAALPDAWAILPRFLIQRRAGRTRLIVTTEGEMPHEALTALMSALAAAPVDAPTAPRNEPHGALTCDKDDFVARVTEARTHIARGELDKVVLHRQTRATRRGLPRACEALTRLAIDQPATTRFAFRVDGRVFLGATPERLVSRRGAAVRADVLAGTLPRGTGARGRDLLHSAKDRAEHELTRRAIDDTLRPLCRALVDKGPQLRTLPHVFHLHTAIRGELDGDHHVLDLVAAIHPTPAVGGVPRAAALAFLAAAEPTSRLWYAGPVGWFRPDGDGDFRVALRCALLDEEHATLFAGAGIVAASDPVRERTEVASKERAMASALGLRSAP